MKTLKGEYHIMKITDAIRTMQNTNGSHLDKIYVPSLKRLILFKPLTTADVKTLARISFLDLFDINTEIIKLSLFDKLCTLDLSKELIKDSKGNVYPPLNSKTLTQLDYLSFLCGIRQMLDTKLTYTFTCRDDLCKNVWEYTLNPDLVFQKLIKEFLRQTEFFEKIDNITGNIWKFELTNPTVLNYIYSRYMLLKFKEKDDLSPEVIFAPKFVRPIIYIKNIWLNDLLILDWPTLLIPQKLTFYNEIPPTITISNTNNNKTVFDKVRETFIELKMYDKIRDFIITCPKCGKEYGGVFNYDSFFTF